MKIEKLKLQRGNFAKVYLTLKEIKTVQLSNSRLFHILDIREAILQKIPEFYEILS